METKVATHTPGPWRVNLEETDMRRWGFVRAGEPMDGAVEGVAVARVTMERKWTINQANARLIAAAPDLLKALQTILTITARAENTAASAAIEQLAAQVVAKAEGR